MLTICDHFFQPDTRSLLLKNGNITTKIMLTWTVLRGAWKSEAWAIVVAPFTQSEALYSMLWFPNATCVPKSAQGVWENAILIKRCCTLDNAKLTFLLYYACHMWPLFSTWYKKSFAQKRQHHYQNYDKMDRLGWCLGKWCLGKSSCTINTKWSTLFNVMFS